MDNLLRIDQKIFASDAGTDEKAVIGSLAAGTPAYSNDPEAIQSLANFKEGLFGTTIGENSPAIEDINSLYFLLTYQLAYLQQKGVSEYSPSSEYYKNSIVQVDGILYKSIVDNNIGNNVSIKSKWTLYVVPNDNVRILQNISTRKFDSFASSNETTYWNSIAYSPSLRLFVAVGRTSGGGAERIIMTSPNGYSWKNIVGPSPASETLATWNSVIWCSGLNLFVACGNNNATGGQVMTSPDGVTWTLRLVPSDAWYFISYKGGDKIYIYNADPSPKGLSSTDGITWSTITPNIQVGSVNYYPSLGKFLAASSAGVIQSTDGVTWSVLAVAVASVSIGSVTYSPELGVYVGVGYSIGGNGVHLTSIDGTTWVATATNLPFSRTKIIWVKELGLFIAAGYQSTGANASMMITSPDGFTWTYRNQVAFDKEVVSLCWSPEQSIIVGVSTNGSLKVSVSR